MESEPPIPGFAAGLESNVGPFLVWVVRTLSLCLVSVETVHMVHSSQQKIKTIFLTGIQSCGKEGGNEDGGSQRDTPI